MAASGRQPDDRVATNRKAFHDYTVLEKFEAGIVLTGTEVKSVRASNVTLTGGYAQIINGQAILHDVTISPYECGNVHNHEPTRDRVLLLHRREIDQLQAATDRQGCTLIPLAMYFKRGFAKVQIGVCKGKDARDKRHDLKKKDAKREIDREIRRNRG